MTKLTRRGVLGAGAAGAAAGALPGSAAAARKRTRRADVVVVGAGLAGLTAARAVRRGGKSVLLLEAARRAGGRVWSHPLGDGEVSERGGTFVGPTQDHMINLAKEYGIDTFPTYNEGNNVAYIEGDRVEWSDTGPTGTAPPDPAILPELAATVALLDEMSKEVPVDAPWEAAKALEYDGQTLETWIRDNSATPRYRNLVPLATRPIFGTEPRDLSLLFVLFYIAASGDETHVGTFERNFNTRDGAQMFRFVGSTSAVVERMARELGRRLLLRHPVRRISQGRGGVRVETDKLSVRAERVIVAIPPALAGRIDYRPALPFLRDQLTQRMGQGTLTKVSARYETPFWRDAGYTGTALSSGGFVSATFDGSPPDGGPGVVFGFVGGDKAREYERLSKDERRARILAEFAEFWGAEAESPQEYWDTRWPAQRWNRGGPVGIHGPG
ncbi:MAG: flavin monoamine oxidase family protein, partial [Thermoleophilaceae bacterium]